MGETIRAFVAVATPPEVKGAVETLIGEMKAAGVKATFTRKENLHLTLKFLGETPVEKLEAVKRGLDQAAEKQTAFQASLRGLGGFPNEKKPRILWIGVADGEKELVALTGGVESALQPLGFPQEDREFTPHLTLGRIKFPKPNPRLEKIFEENGSRSFGKWNVRQLLLVQSTLHSEGPKYETIHTATLTGTD